MKKIIAMLLSIVMVFALVACGSDKSDAGDSTAAPSATETATTTEEPGVLNLMWHQAIGVDTLFENPWHDLQSLYPYMVFDAMLSQNSDGTYVPKLATEWTVSDDGLTYNFTIRDGVKWQDGEDFTAADVVWTLNTAPAHPSNGTYLTSHMKNIVGYADVLAGTATELAGVTSSGNVVTITLSTADRDFLYGMGCLYILPQHLLGDVAAADIDANAYWAKPVGTGAYMIDEVSFPDYFTCVANTTYWGNQPGVANVLFTSYEAGGNDAAVSSLISGTLDYAFGNELNDIAVADNVTSQNADMTTKLQTSYYTRFFGINLGQRADGNTKSDLQNAEVREALNLIIDKNAIADCYNGQATALSTFANPASDWYNSDIPAFTRDVETAKTMLEEAGFDFSQTIDIAYYYTDQTTADIMALITQNFADAGVTVSTTLLTGDLTAAIYTTSNFDMLYGAYSGASNPIQMYQFMTSTGALTYMGNAEERGAIFDTLYTEFTASADDKAAKDYGDQLQAAGLQNGYMIPVYSLNTVVIYNSAKVTIPEDIFVFDNSPARNWKFDQWALN